MPVIIILHLLLMDNKTLHMEIVVSMVDLVVQMVTEVIKVLMQVEELVGIQMVVMHLQMEDLDFYKAVLVGVVILFILMVVLVEVVELMQVLEVELVILEVELVDGARLVMEGEEALIIVELIKIINQV